LLTYETDCEYHIQTVVYCLAKLAVKIQVQLQLTDTQVSQNQPSGQTFTLVPSRSTKRNEQQSSIRSVDLEGTRINVRSEGAIVKASRCQYLFRHSWNRKGNSKGCLAEEEADSSGSEERQLWLNVPNSCQSTGCLRDIVLYSNRRNQTPVF
jgi:hypothetical protein